jgi:GMP synthase (glutamine-hydrolysing)
MRKILVCQHVAYEILGTLNPLIKQHGFRIRYVNFGRFPHHEPSLKGYDGMILLGGPMSVDQIQEHPHLLHELHMIEEALKRDIPILGICLGSQLIAKALGARVEKNPKKEIGWSAVHLTKTGREDPVLANFRDEEKIFQWHQDTFDIPKGTVHLARSELCSSQAFRYGNKVYGFQFHLEVDEPMIHRWLEVPHHKKELEALQGKVDPETIRQETQRYIDHSKKLSQKTFGEFIKLFGVQKKFVRLSSR